MSAAAGVGYSQLVMKAAPSRTNNRAGVGPLRSRSNSGSTVEGYGSNAGVGGAPPAPPLLGIPLTRPEATGNRGNMAPPAPPNIYRDPGNFLRYSNVYGFMQHRIRNADEKAEAEKRRAEAERRAAENAAAAQRQFIEEASALTAPRPPIVPIRQEVIPGAPIIRTPQVDTLVKRIETRFDTLFKLTEDALGESKQLGARELEGAVAQKAVGGPCASLPEDTSVAVTITFIRHSESCANVLKRNTTLGGLSQKGYTDPELSERGVAMVKDRASKLSTSGIARNMSPPWIIGCSTLFRAEQTAMYLSDGIREMRASDRIVVFPYIQETGSGQENTAMTDDQRLAEKLYDKLPGGVSSRERLVTTLFDTEPEKERIIPNVDKFFTWLGCNLALVYKAGFTATNALPATMNLLIVTHSNLMTEIYKKLRNPGFIDQRDSSIKYDNLEAMIVTTTYSSNPHLVSRPTIRYAIDKYVPSPALIKASCPDSVCRKPVCPKGAVAAPTAPTGTHPYQEVCDAIVGLNAPPTNSATYKSRIKGPIIDKLGANTRNSVKRARKTMAAYDPPGAFRGIFGGRPRTAEHLAANKESALRNLGCTVPERNTNTGLVLVGSRESLPSAAAVAAPQNPGAAAPDAALTTRSAAGAAASGTSFSGNVGFYGDDTGQGGGARRSKHHRVTRHRRTPMRISRRTQKCRH